MTTSPRGTSVTDYPTDLSIRTRRDLHAPIGLVFDALTRPEHVRHWFAPFEDTVTVCEIDLRVGGDFHIVFVTPEGQECSFRGTYLELQRPDTIVNTWRFEGWPDAEAVERVELVQAGDVTMMTNTLTFSDATGRAHMTKTDGQDDSNDKLEVYLTSVLESDADQGSVRRGLQP